jgi:hypothetical protein
MHASYDNPGDRIKDEHGLIPTDNGSLQEALGADLHLP